jgi:hypothetical protein
VLRPFCLFRAEVGERLCTAFSRFENERVGEREREGGREGERARERERARGREGEGEGGLRVPVHSTLQV